MSDAEMIRLLQETDPSAVASQPATMDELSRQIVLGDGRVATSIAIVEPEGAKRNLLEPPRLAPVPPPSKFPGLAHEEALRLELPPIKHLVRGAAQQGSVGTLTGLPESFKSFLAMEIALKVAGGGASVLGLDVETHGPVGYWWQDDSRENELGRLKQYALQHGYTDGLPLLWHLNEDLRLPDHLEDLRAEVERERQVLVVLDSLYNFLPARMGLKDEEVAQVLDQVKSHICDPTGCAVAFVDHAPWPSESNRGNQMRGYGSVFKAAAIRWGIYLQRKRGSEEVFIEARGNNVVGFKKSLFTFDEQALEFRAVAQEEIAEADLEQRIIDYVRAHSGASQTEIEKQVTGRATRIREALNRLSKLPRGADARPGLWDAVEPAPTLVLGPGTAADGKYYFFNDEAGSGPVPASGTDRDG